MTPDLFNGLFEAVGAWFTWVNAYRLYKDKQIKGVYWPMWAFFTLWGFWNLYFYPTLDQWWSFYGGVLLVLGNVAWTGQAIVVVWKERRKRKAGCKVPPSGWWCSREPGHDGPCAARPL